MLSDPLARVERRFETTFEGKLAQLTGPLLTWTGEDLSAVPVADLPTDIEVLLRARNMIDGELLRRLLVADRTSPQRCADALTELCQQALTAGDLPEVAGERPHLNLTVSLETLELRAGAPAAQLGHTGPVAGETARRLACDASISRIITDGPSQILDVGRRTRTIGPALRRALVVRDAGCIHPGCDRPPSWCEGHHLRHWVDGGTTDLANPTSAKTPRDNGCTWPRAARVEGDVEKSPAEGWGKWTCREGIDNRLSADDPG